MTHRPYPSALLTLTLIWGCGSNTPAVEPEPRALFEPMVATAPVEPQPAPEPATEPSPLFGVPAAHGDATPEQVTALASATNRFAIDLYGQLRSRGGDLVVSPASLALALTMTWAGARGDTAEQMRRALRIDAGPEAVHAAAAQLLSTWNVPGRDTYELRVVNRLFADGSYRLDEPFVALMTARYGAPVEALDFRNAPAAAAGRINAWVGEQTADRIPQIVPPEALDQETRLVLANAIYFLGQWSRRFEEDDTEARAFHAARGARQVPTMHTTSTFGYAHVRGVTVLEMGYLGGDISMVIALPDQRRGLAALERRLSIEEVDRWVTALEATEVEVYLPRFTARQGFSVEEALAALGMTRAFDRGAADFTGMASPPDPDDHLFLSDVFHEAFIEVNERGTEAAAATTAIMLRAGNGHGEPHPLPVFRADHPFLFMIRDGGSGAILFLGRVAEPEASSARATSLAGD